MMSASLRTRLTATSFMPRSRAQQEAVEGRLRAVAEQRAQIVTRRAEGRWAEGREPGGELLLGRGVGHALPRCQPGIVEGSDLVVADRQEQHLLAHHGGDQTAMQAIA